MTAFDLLNLFGPTWSDVPRADPGFLYGEREFGAIVDLNFPNGEGQRLSYRGQQVETGAVILARVEPQDAIARAFIQSRVLDTVLANDVHLLHIDPHTVARVFFSEEGRVA